MRVSNPNPNPDQAGQLSQADMERMKGMIAAPLTLTLTRTLTPTLTPTLTANPLINSNPN